MKSFTIEVTKKDSSTTYTKIDHYQIKDNLLTMVRSENKKIIIPLRQVEEIDVEKFETINTNGEFAGGDQN